jgi:hypothetical protein
MDLRHYLLLSVASMALFVVDESLGLVTVAMMVWLGGVLAVRLRPGLRSILADRRRPRADELAAVLIGQAGAAATFMVLALLQLAAVMNWRAPSLQLPAEAIPWAMAAAVAVAPLWLQMNRPGGPGSPEPPLWPFAAGLAAGAPLLMGLVFLVHGVAAPLMTRLPSSETLRGALMMLPPAALLTAYGSGWIVQAAHRRAVAGPVFGAAARVALAAWAVVAVALVLDATGAFAAVWPPTLGARGGVARTAYTLVIALAWIRALLAIRRIEVRGPVAAAAIIVMLWIGFLVSLWAPVAIPRDMWAQLVAVVMAPVLLASAAAVAVGAPRLASRLAGPRPQPV